FTEPAVTNPTEDLMLARAAHRSGRVVWAGKVVIERAKNDILNSYLLKPIPPLLTERTDWGLINVIEDDDGFIRSYLLYYEHDQQKYLPLALRAYLRLTSGSAELDHANNNGDALRLNGKPLPYFTPNTFLINFRGPAGTFPTYSLANVLDDSTFALSEAEDTDIFTEHLRWGTFKNKIVFVGASAEELQDNKLTPFFSFGVIKRKIPGVEVHANALSTLLREDFITRAPPGADYLLVLAAGFVTMIIVLSLRPSIGIIFGILEVLALFVLAVALFTTQQLWIPVISPAVAIVLSFIGNAVQLVVVERRGRKLVREVFSQYVSKNVVDTMLASGEMPKFGGEKRELTVLFSDVRGFTTYCEKHAPEVVVQRLNEYLTEMVEVVFRNQGTLDKFVGDELMALYGAPHYFPEHAEKACVTACEMIANLREIQKRWSANAQEYFQIGIGINTGKMIVGNLGSQQKFDYTAIGDEVNLGARLEGANKQYWTAIIISESTYEQVKSRARARELDLVRVKGKLKPVKIYELLSMNGLPAIEEDLIINVYQQGLAYYKQREWYKALKEFKRVLRYFPSDGPCRVYVSRCLDFIENAPPLDWDGVYEFKTK
ncbi:MAG: CHASE2 domain-containing protein, partial [candidate division KSB1 bacterium]|nr:CHASE2 domain-containing protein [candidate division KSB1 bacterium]